jgi:release factor glutamine methyltransferase
VSSSFPERPVTVHAALAAARRLIGPVDARVLMTALLGCDAACLVAHGETPLAAEQALTYEDWVSRRARGEPVAYLTGRREFYGRTFRITPAVLIPRPETELLVEIALAWLRGRERPAVLDLGTGSGCIALTLAAECAGAHITGVDCSEAALAVARGNARALGVEGVTWRLGHWFEAVQRERYDLVVANPPYISGDDPHLKEGDLRYEPVAALTPGGDGLGAIRTIVSAARNHLNPGGALWVEHGHDQGPACRALLEACGYVEVGTHRDLAGMERVTGGRAQENG